MSPLHHVARKFSEPSTVESLVSLVSPPSQSTKNLYVQHCTGLYTLSPSTSTKVQYYYAMHASAILSVVSCFISRLGQLS